jgi:cell wall assembly regulator SMI1
MKGKASIAETFSAIVASLERLRRPAARLLQPGLTRPQIATIEARLPFKLTRELVSLYRTTNGTPLKKGSTVDQLSFFPGYYLLSLEDAATEYRQKRSAPQWKKGWFPLFANGAGDYYAVPCAPTSPGVIGFLRGEPDQPVEYASVTSMFATLAECFATGAFFVRKGDFGIDDDKHRRVAIKLNPRLALWEAEAAEEAEAARHAEALKVATQASNLLLKKQKPLQALSMFEKVVDVPDHPQWVYVNALSAVILAFEKGPVEPARIRHMLKVCLAQEGLHPDIHVNAGFCWMALGEKDKCIASLQMAKRKGAENMKVHLAEPVFAPLATDRRFMALVKSGR